MQAPQASLLPDGNRLHLNHGPIDLIIEARGNGRERAYRAAVARFATVLQELVDELPLLRSPASPTHQFVGTTARRMQQAVLPHLPAFITPMAAVAGAVADEMIGVISAIPDIAKAYVNNGGDAAFFLTPGEKIAAAIAAPNAGSIEIRADDTWRGIATSGWRGRSHSLGIADTVTVIAENAAMADAAATMIANAVDLPDHPAIARKPAAELAPDSDLGTRLVTTDVGTLTATESGEALDRGAAYADGLLQRGLIAGALLMLNDEIRIVGMPNLLTSGDLAHA